jgi:Ca-activated chloride channel family protein
MRFENPQWLYLFFLVPVLMFFYAWADRRKQAALQRFGNLELLRKLSSSPSGPSGFKRPARKLIFMLLAVSFLVLTLARPQWGTKMQTIKRKGLDILIALDTSKSMLAEDIKPNRLERAKHEIAGLIDTLEGDRVGLICFAGTSFVQCPLTLDYAAAKIFLKVIDTLIIPKGGTAIGDAIQQARRAFVQGDRKYKVLILLTDGEDYSSHPLDAAKEAAQEGIRIYTIGLGSEAGEPIPLKDQNGIHIGYQQDQDGKVIMTKLDQETLEKIALLTDGKYYHATTAEMELGKVYQGIGNMEKKDLQSKKYVQYEDRFVYFLFPAFFFLLLEFFLEGRRKVRKTWGGRFE